MGKEWYWTGKSSKRGGGAEAETPTSSGCMCAVFHFFDFHPFNFPTINQQQQQQASFKPPSCISEDYSTVPKGAEAPRNSLESENGNGTVSSKEDNFKIPKNIIQIKTSGSTRTNGGGGGNLNDISSEISSSPGIKTPTLVARLMGLDLLPNAHSPTSSSSSSSSCLSTPNPQGNVPHLHHLRHKQHIQTKPRNSIDSSDIAASRSLPETPRISSARRSDVDYHHRLSLQMNKENMTLGEDLELPRFSFSKRKCDENNSSKSPSHYARQIVKQVKESVSRKVGQDITNTLKTREEFVGQLRSKKSPKTSLKAIDETSPGKHSNPSSYSPRLRFIDTNKHKPSTTTPSPLNPKDQNMLKLPSTPHTQPQLPRVFTKPKPQALLSEQQESHNKKSVTKCKKVTNEKFNSRLKRPPQTTDIIRNKQEEPFIIRPTSPTTRVSDIKTTKSKKTHPLSSNLLNNINTVPNLLPVKIDPSPPATKIPSKQSQASDTQESKSISQLSSCSRQRYKQERTSTLATRESTNTSENKLNGASITGTKHHTPEFQYITGILNRTTTPNKEGTPTTTLSFNQWFSPTHLLDPSIFHHLEHRNNDKNRNFSSKNELGQRWNRRLLFDLVDEVLKEIIKPKGNQKRLWFLKGVCYQGSVEGLIERVWKRVEEFPRAKCEVLEDIDALIEAQDMEDEDENGTEEEGKGLVAEIEGNIWDTLVHETVMVMHFCGSVGSGVHVFA
ncbi:uncharacterized protein LOC113866680 [Abrus precatorius]|uniref:Uncharacterized protein LOC113866680 n=1 Tax=Abrus precatorius TaxID=3816 RepID=A0A8B8LLM2_ABRPR|nr:uncharacterized protein LOC113866680 [Abrus precatorius]